MLPGTDLVQDLMLARSFSVVRGAHHSHHMRRQVGKIRGLRSHRHVNNRQPMSAEKSEHPLDAGQDDLLDSSETVFADVRLASTRKPGAEARGAAGAGVLHI